MILVHQQVCNFVLLPQGQLVYGINIELWNISVVNKSTEIQIVDVKYGFSGSLVSQHFSKTIGIARIQRPLEIIQGNRQHRPIVFFLFPAPFLGTFPAHIIIEGSYGAIGGFDGSDIDHGFSQKDTLFAHFPTGVEFGPRRQNASDLCRVKEFWRVKVLSQFLAEITINGGVWILKGTAHDTMMLSITQTI